MIKLLVIADDFTGAMDTGVQFKAKGTLIQVASENCLSALGSLAPDLQVLIVDAETRHMQADEAYRTVYRIVKAAVEAKIPCIYKKTDSGLRGNIGSELTAALDASGNERLHFIPAFPRLGRTTVEGVHYINGQPVAQSVFGEDPFEPVRSSQVQEIIRSQSAVRTCLMGTQVPRELPDGVLIYDSATDEELKGIALELEARGELTVMAGCAGFASVLPQVLGLVAEEEEIPRLYPRLLTVCGSINPITLAQLDEGERNGMLRIQLTPEQKLDPGWVDSPQGVRVVEDWLKEIRRSDGAILEGNRRGEGDATQRYAQTHGLSLEEVRRRISQTMGAVLERLLRQGLEATLLITGGDTLLAFLREIHQDTLVPIGELAPGVVLSRIRYQEKQHYMISKSGGFGAASLLLDLRDRLTQQETKRTREELAC